MKIIFVLDDQTVLVSSPEELQLRQIEAGLSALVIPAGRNEKDEEMFRPLVTYPVVLISPPKPDPIPAGVATPVPAEPSVQKPSLVK